MQIWAKHNDVIDDQVLYHIGMCEFLPYGLVIINKDNYFLNIVKR